MIIWFSFQHLFRGKSSADILVTLCRVFLAVTADIAQVIYGLTAEERIVEAIQADDDNWHQISQEENKILRSEHEINLVV